MNKRIKDMLIQMVFQKLVVVNGEDTDAELNLDIAKHVVEEEYKCKVVPIIKNVPDGKYYVYKYDDAMDFQEFSNPDDAVREAVKDICALVVSNNKIVKYDSIGDKRAYYVDQKSHKAMLVAL